MSSISILSVCISAFILIFLLLSVLSVVMRLLTWFMPPIETDDNAVFAAITMAYESSYPDRQVTNIKETT
ncbi:MAG: hypothetical protein PVF46_04540 [Lysobacterales bacterium]|jgi:hypothetical protein